MTDLTTRLNALEKSTPAQSLKGCPFCGGNNIDCWIPNDPCMANMWRARCMGCSGQTSYAESKNDAIHAWNTRAPDPALLAENERDRELISALSTALEWYRKLFVDHPTQFALDVLKKDQGKIAGDALDLWEIWSESALNPPTEGGV